MPTPPNTSTAYAYVGEGLLKQRVAVTVDHDAINAQLLSELESKVTALVDKLLDDAAKAKGYKDIISACSYAGFTNPYQNESKQFIAWRGGVWNYLYVHLAAIKAGTEPVPSNVDAIIALLPPITDYVPV